MDLSVVRDALDDFNTFITGIADLFKALPTFVKDFAEFFAPNGDSTNGEVWTEQTSSLFGSSNSDAPGADADASSFGSSEETPAQPEQPAQ